MRLTRTTYTMIREGSPVEKSQLAPGDLIFPNPGHVQLYIGGGKVCEAPQSGIPVRVVPMWGFWKARRVASPGSGGSPAPAPGGAQGFAGLPGIPGVDQLEWIVNPHNWLRIAEFIAGVIVLFVAFKSVGS